MISNRKPQSGYADHDISYDNCKHATICAHDGFVCARCGKTFPATQSNTLDTVPFGSIYLGNDCEHLTVIVKTDAQTSPHLRKIPKINRYLLAKTREENIRAIVSHIVMHILSAPQAVVDECMMRLQKKIAQQKKISRRDINAAIYAVLTEKNPFLKIPRQKRIIGAIAQFRITSPAIYRETLNVMRHIAKCNATIAATAEEIFRSHQQYWVGKKPAVVAAACYIIAAGLHKNPHVIQRTLKYIPNFATIQRHVSTILSRLHHEDAIKFIGVQIRSLKKTLPKK